jgi:hypothetical protein
MSPAASNGPLTRLTGLFKRSVASALEPTPGRRSSCAFLLSSPEDRRVPASVGHHLTSYASWGTWFLLPKRASGTILTPPLYQGLSFEHGRSSMCHSFSANLRSTFPPEYRLMGLETLHKRDKQQLCISARCRKSNHRDDRGLGNDCEKQTSLPSLGQSMVEICDAGPHHDR